MGLMPVQFWSLTPREFWIKHTAFKRSEDRIRALVLEHSLVSVPGRKQNAINKIQQQVNAFRRYPIKRWLQTSD